MHAFLYRFLSSLHYNTDGFGQGRRYAPFSGSRTHTLSVAPLFGKRPFVQRFTISVPFPQCESKNKPANSVTLCTSASRWHHKITGLPGCQSHIREFSFPLAPPPPWRFQSAQQSASLFFLFFSFFPLCNLPLNSGSCISYRINVQYVMYHGLASARRLETAPL